MTESSTLDMSTLVSKWGGNLSLRSKVVSLLVKRLSWEAETPLYDESPMTTVAYLGYRAGRATVERG